MKIVLENGALFAIVLGFIRSSKSSRTHFQPTWVSIHGKVRNETKNLVAILVKRDILKIGFSELECDIRECCVVNWVPTGGEGARISGGYDCLTPMLGKL